MKKAISLLFLLVFLSNMASALENKKNETIVDPDKYVLTLIDSATYHSNYDMQLAYSYINKALDIINTVQDRTKIIVYNKVSKIFYSLELYQLSLEFLFKALNVQDNMKEKDILLYVDLYSLIGNSYYRIGNTEDSRLYYQKSVDIIEENKEILDKKGYNYMIVFSTLAFIEREEKNFTKAKDLILKTLDYAKSKNDTLIYVRALRNLSHISFDMRDTTKGLEHLERAIELAEMKGLKPDIAVMYIDKGFVLYNIDSVRYAKDAIKYYTMSYEITNKNMELLSVRKESTSNLYHTYKSLGDYRNALKYNEIFIKLSEESAAADIEKQVTALKLESIYNDSIEQLERKQDRTYFIFYIVITCVCIISMLFYILYQFQKNKVTKRKLQNEILQDKLDFKNKEFTSKVLQILQINRILDKINKDIQDITNDAPDEIQKKLLNVTKDLKANKNNLNWKEFEKLFIETNDDFYKRLTSDFPDLTKNELRLCAFLKMNMTTKEISAITNQREQSITMARWRLRKKLGIENENINITNFLLKYTSQKNTK